jgi:hypothetical protein
LQCAVAAKHTETHSDVQKTRIFLTHVGVKDGTHFLRIAGWEGTQTPRGPSNASHYFIKVPPPLEGTAGPSHSRPWVTFVGARKTATFYVSTVDSCSLILLPFLSRFTEEKINFFSIKNK